MVFNIFSLSEIGSYIGCCPATEATPPKGSIWLLVVGNSRRQCPSVSQILAPYIPFPAVWLAGLSISRSNIVNTRPTNRDLVNIAFCLVLCISQFTLYDSFGSEFCACFRLLDNNAHTLNHRSSFEDGKVSAGMEAGCPKQGAVRVGHIHRRQAAGTN